MAPELKKDNSPIVGITPASLVPPPPKKHISGIEPGSLRGRSNFEAPKAVDPEEEIWAKIKNMTAAEMKRWLKYPENAAAFEAARRNKANRI